MMHNLTSRGNPFHVKNLLYLDDVHFISALNVEISKLKNILYRVSLLRPRYNNKGSEITEFWVNNQGESFSWLRAVVLVLPSYEHFKG